MSLLSEAERGAELHRKLVEIVRIAKFSFVGMGKLLYQLSVKNLFKKAIGDGIETWEEYLRQPEIGLSIGEANRLVQIYETFVLRFGYSEEEISEIPVKNLHYLLPLAKKSEPEQMEDLISDAKVLSQSDFRIKVAEHKYPTEERTYEYIIMKKCKEDGTMTKIHGVSSETIEYFLQKKL